MNPAVKVCVMDIGLLLRLISNGQRKSPEDFSRGFGARMVSRDAIGTWLTQLGSCLLMMYPLLGAAAQRECIERECGRYKRHDVEGRGGYGHISPCQELSIT